MSLEWIIILAKRDNNFVIKRKGLRYVNIIILHLWNKIKKPEEINYLLRYDNKIKKLEEINYLLYYDKIKKLEGINCLLHLRIELRNSTG